MKQIGRYRAYTARELAETEWPSNKIEQEITLEERCEHGTAVTSFCLDRRGIDDACTLFTNDVVGYCEHIGFCCQGGFDGICYSSVVDNPKSLPVVSCVYAVYGMGLKIQYIGKSVNLRGRWESGTHKMQKRMTPPDEWFIDWWEMPKECIGLVEQVLLLKLKPPCNTKIF